MKNNKRKTSGKGILREKNKFFSKDKVNKIKGKMIECKKNQKKRKKVVDKTF